MANPPPFDAAAYQAQVDHLAKIAATSTDECVIATLIAAQNKHVEERVVEKAKHYVWKGLFCANRADGKIAVVFNFECHPGQICLVKPWFAAVVDLEFGTVYGIQDPYRPEHIRQAKPCKCSSTEGAAGSGYGGSFGRRPECKVCAGFDTPLGHVPGVKGYAELVDALKRAKNNGKFNDMGGCRRFVDDAAFKAYLLNVLLIAEPIVDLIIAAAQGCGHCACDYDVF